MPEWLYLAKWVFLLGGVAGVVLESGWAVAVERRRRFEPRAGILSLSLAPLYGAGAVLGSFALGPFADLPGVVFLLGAVAFSAVEYVVSLVLERAFGSVFWDYSERPFNLHGRICLEFAFYWGLLSLALVYAADPALRSVIDLIPRPAGDVLAAALLAVTAAATIAATASFPLTNLSARNRRLLADSAGRDRAGRELDIRSLADENRAVTPAPAPMLAKAVEKLPEGDLLYEPKWDGFRGIVQVNAAPDGTPGVEIGSRGDKPLTRYFPDLVDAFGRLLPPCVLDGEIVVTIEWDGKRRLHWDSLTQRIHPAASRVTKLAQETPASFVAFDVLSIGDRDLSVEPLSVRRAELEKLFADVPPPLHVTRTTRDVEVARRWLDEFEGAGLDGVVAKPLADPYQPGKRAMFKIKHKRTADVVLLGYRIHKSGAGVGSLLVGLYHDGQLRPVGGVSAFSDARRLELIDELSDLVERGEDGSAATGEKERSRFASANKDVSFVRLRPERVLEVRYDQMEAGRFRHTVQFDRWRPDRDPESCTYDQLEVPAVYDLDDVLQ